MEPGPTSAAGPAGRGLSGAVARLRGRQPSRGRTGRSSKARQNSTGVRSVTPVPGSRKHEL